MKIATITGVTKSPELQVTKAIGALILSSDLALSALTTEKLVSTLNVETVRMSF